MSRDPFEDVTIRVVLFLSGMLVALLLAVEFPYLTQTEQSIPPPVEWSGKRLIIFTGSGDQCGMSMYPLEYGETRNGTIVTRKWQPQPQGEHHE